MIVRFVGLIALAWSLGFAAFMLLLPEPSPVAKTDAIVVPTGGVGRLDRGFALLEEGRARRLLVTGVAPSVGKRAIAAAWRVSPRLLACCVDLGDQAVDTRSNAEETATWVREHRYRSVRLVTSDWHMARARMELAAALDDRVQLVPDGVASEPRLGLLVNEYNKLLLRRVALWTGLGK